MPDLRLPVLANPRQKLVAGLLVIVACGVLYTAPSLLTLQRAVEIPVPRWEQAIPYVPQSVWPYLAQYPLLLLAYFGTRDLARCTRFLVAAVAVQAAAAAAFLLVPLRYPREWHQALPGTDALTLVAADWVRHMDAPVNCCPSLHVTSCLLCVWLTGTESQARSLLVAAVASASIASTLTFKQHYGIDLVAGALLAAVMWRLAPAWITSASPAPSSVPPATRAARRG
jgi:hypothetical protein